MHVVRMLAVAAALAGVTEANGGTLAKAEIAGQVQQFIDKGVVTGCGVVFTAFELPSSIDDVLQVFNGSYSLMDARGGLVKGRSSTVSARLVASGQMTPKSLKMQKTERVWFKAGGSNATAPIEGSAPLRSEDAGYVLYVAGLGELASITGAIIDKQPIQIGIKSSAKNYDVVLYGTVRLSDEDQAQLAQCLADWVEVMKKKFRDQLHPDTPPAPTASAPE
jgi:hypothetical protein